MAMDAKDLRIESALGARGDDGNTKFAQSGTTLQTNKSYHDIGSNSLAKVDVPAARPCAIIGPDRVVPPQSLNSGFLKKVPVEPWPCTENIYQHPPEYPNKPTEYQPSRNISPRQTFQENMQRIMVPPSYASVKHSEDNCLKSPKFSDVPYTISTINNELNSVKSSEGLLPNNSPNQPVIPNGWASGGVNVRPLRPYGAPEFYQYSEYPNYPGPRPISMIRPHRNIHEDGPPGYQDRLYNEANIRFKPYPTTKERPLHQPQPRYEYIPNYPSVFHPHAAYPPHKFDIQKTIPTHAYSMYPPVPLKYLDRRMTAPQMEKFSRSPTQQVNFNSPFCNQNIPSTYGSIPGNCMQNRGYPYAPDPSTKHMIQNKIYYEANNAHKYYTSPENIFMNDNINRPPNLKNDVLYPSYPSPMNIHSIPTHHIYRKESSIKGFDQAMHYRNMEYSTNLNPLSRVPLQFLPQTMSMSSDSNTTNDRLHLVGNTQDDFGYASQSSAGSLKSREPGVTRMSSDVYRRNDVRHEPNSHLKSGLKVDNNMSSKDKKDLDVRQFLQMWNEGEDESSENKARQRDINNSLGHYESGNTQEQLYVLDLVNVPNEELAKYDHIQKISKLPENIKGYNSIELLNQYEKLVESPSLSHFAVPPSQSKQKDLQVPLRNGSVRHGMNVLSANARPLSPLDVEAKISQSVIHKEVGCNFEIKPCSPQMMNVEIATPVINVLGERLIEKVVNSVNIKSPLHHRIEESNQSSSRNSPKVTSCKMVNNHYPSPNVNDSLKTNYCLQDLEGNSGVCLASLPRLDNEIELNFPEINQQFINANKISSIQDLPILDTEIGATTNKSKSKIHNQPFTSENLHSGSESDKEVSKLSKYRKHKRNSIPNENSDMSRIPHPRTDSVIIKNPENAKSQENINNIHLLSKNTSYEENIIKPLSTESEIVLNKSDKNVTETIYENISDYNSIGVSDTAIDFSINKSDDEQNNSIKNINNISVALQNNIEIVKNIKTAYKTTDSSIGKSDKNITKLLEKISDTDDFSILQPKSPELDNFTCSSVLQNIDLKSSDETHETVITSLTPNESDIKLSNDLSTEKFIPQNHLTCGPHDIVNLSKNITKFNITTENNSATIVEINNQTQQDVLAENLDNVITAICEPQYNLMNTDQTTLTDVTVINDEDHSKRDQKEHYSLIEDDADRCKTHLVAETKKVAYDQDLGIQETEYVKIQTMSMESEFRLQKPAENLEIEKGILKSKTETEEVTNVIELKTDKHIDLTKKCATQNHVKTEECDIVELGCITPDENDGLMNVSKINFDRIQIESKNIDVFENNKMVSETSTKIKSDINAEIQTLPSLYKHQTMGKNPFIAKLQQFTVIFRKELFSSRFQNLWMQNEGFCSSLESLKPQNFQIFSQNVNGKHSRSEIKDDSKTTMETIIEENTIYIEHKISPDRIVSSEENKGNSFEVEIKNPADLPDIRTITGARIADLEGENHSEAISNVFKDTIHNQTTVESNQTSKSLVEVAENNTNKDDSKFPENIGNGNINFNDNIKENICVTEQLICNQLPNRRKRTLKRSLSESAVNLYNALGEDTKGNFDNNFMHCKKRPKITDTEIFVESQMIADNFASFIQSNRRNSISTLYNEENVSLCIVIDNDCILSEENESCEKICYTDLSDEECLTTICTEGEPINPELSEDISLEDAVPISIEGGAINSDITECFSYENDISIDANTGILNSEIVTENISNDKQEQCAPENNELLLQDMEVETVQESWVEDVACIETVFSDDVAEDVVISAPSSPKDTESSEEESDITSYMFNVNENENTDKVKYIYGSQMCDDDALLVEKLYRTPQMDVNKTLIDRESQFLQGYNRYYDTESLEKILSEYNTLDTCTSAQNESSDNSVLLPHSIACEYIHGNKENLKDLLSEQDSRDSRDGKYSIADLPTSVQKKVYEEKISKTYDDCNMQFSKSGADNFESYKIEDKLQYAISSSPEVSSTTPEEKGPGILLTIRSYKGTKISEVNEMSESFKHLHSQKYNNSSLSSRPLITKAAQKYIPPLKETIRDLKVKIRLPKQSLYKLQQLKNSKEVPKIDTSRSKNYIKSIPQESPKKAKPKPKFEDVLMSIDEIQFKKHKEKNKKTKQSVPKVIIKKNENGAHYASTETKETYNPDLTGRKWQPWVFLEKSNFVDKMALKKKFKAIYSHRKKTFVLAENFRKYKSISNPKFVISHPKCNDNISTGNLKYTIRLKHT